MKHAVVSYWVGETGDTEVWLYDSQEDAADALAKLWKRSFELARKDRDFIEEDSYHDDDFAVVAWNNGLYRYFEAVRPNNAEGSKMTNRDMVNQPADGNFE